MGIDTESARFLVSSKLSGVSFQRCATLGRQNYFLGNRETRNLLQSFGIDPQLHPKLLSAHRGFAEPFWEMLGTRELMTIDASDFEGASKVHDMNQPVPDEWKESFDAVCDVGTLEHIFNFPTAIRSCLTMIKPGGHFMAHTTANNYFGHGFYQFSPELFFRILSPKNGFQMERLVAVEYGPRRRWFEVTDPEIIRARVNLINAFPVLIFVRAKKIATVPVLVEPPQQSDYFQQWNSPPAGPVPGEARPAQKTNAKTGRFARAFLESAPRLARFLEAFTGSPLIRRWSFRNRQAFTRIRDKR
ncbi:MAG: methyltransferase family protein [Pedosphaera sp.]|nr:methyltransferase family protein [Pedosphaera sp.]